MDDGVPELGPSVSVYYVVARIRRLVSSVISWPYLLYRPPNILINLLWAEPNGMSTS